MKVAILFPSPANRPVGGYKIIYSYVEKIYHKNLNYDFTFYYPLTILGSSRIKKYLKYLKYRYFNKVFYAWSTISSIHNITHTISVNIKDLKQADIIIATSVETAIFIKNNKLDQYAKVLYFIQHFENWNISDEEVIATYHYGFKNIVVSKWLKDILLKKQASVSLHLPNPVDDVFVLKKNLQERIPNSIFFLYHIDKWKGSKEALEALRKLKAKHPDINVSCFSAFSRPNDFPDWINYFHQPSRGKLVDLYNDHMMFLSSSYSEGYGLPPAEAMACGCSVVTTASGGVDDFAIPNETAIVVSSPPNPNEISNTLFNLLDDKALMNKLSENGNNKINTFSWDKNTTQLLELFQ